MCCNCNKCHYCCKNINLCCKKHIIYKINNNNNNNCKNCIVGSNNCTSTYNNSNNCNSLCNSSCNSSCNNSNNSNYLKVIKLCQDNNFVYDKQILFDCTTNQYYLVKNKSF